MAYPWPGNVRQLENAVERAIAFSHGRSQIDLQDLAPEIQNQPAPTDSSEVWFPDDGLDFDKYIEAVELSLIKRSLERTQGNKRQAAKLLNLKRTTLIEKLKRLEQSPGSPKLPRQDKTQHTCLRGTTTGRSSSRENPRPSARTRRKS